MKKIFIILGTEIILKSNKVRKIFIKNLLKNIVKKLKLISDKIIVNYFWDRLEIINRSIFDDIEIIKHIKYMPGINKILVVEEFYFYNFKILWNQFKYIFNNRIIHDKTFAIKVKKSGEFPFSKKDLQSYLGHKLNLLIPKSLVQLTNPKFLLEIRLLSNKRWIFIKDKIIGIDGFPINKKNKVLSLISGGFDSTLASFLILKKGCNVYFCYFNFYPFSHKLHIIKIISELCNMSGLENINIIIVPLEKLSNLILNLINPNYVPIIFKRLMIKISTKIAEIYHIKTLITGESLGQVSTQTLKNIHIIDQVTNLTILRPLITYNKKDIISHLKQLNLEHICNGIPEYCGLFGKKVTASACIKKAIKEEEKIPEHLLKEAVQHIKLYNKKMIEKYKNIIYPDYIPEIINMNAVKTDCLILDIRHKSQQLKKPFICKHEKIRIISIPYIELPEIIDQLDKDLIWLLFCENTHLSYLQAINLYNKGYKNIKVLQYYF